MVNCSGEWVTQSYVAEKYGIARSSLRFFLKKGLLTVNHGKKLLIKEDDKLRDLIERRRDAKESTEKIKGWPTVKELSFEYDKTINSVCINAKKNGCEIVKRSDGMRINVNESMLAWLKASSRNFRGTLDRWQKMEPYLDNVYKISREMAFYGNEIRQWASI